MASKKQGGARLTPEQVAAQIQKTYGVESITNMSSDGRSSTKVRKLPTGLPALDHVLGGGIPRGRIIEIYGPESSGKTTLAAAMISAAQFYSLLHSGYIRSNAVVDSEHALDPDWIDKLKVNMEYLLVAQPDNGEEAFAIAEDLVVTGEVDIVVADSVAAMTPKAMIEGDYDKSPMGIHARLMSQGLPKINQILAENPHSIYIMINQIRNKFVMMGNPETTTGGNSLKFYASMRLDVRRKIEDHNRGKDETYGDSILGNDMIVKAVKNKVGVPFRKTSEKDVSLDFEEGFDILMSLIQLLNKVDSTIKSGSWYDVGGQKFQGDATFKKMMIEDPALVGQVCDIIKSKVPDFFSDFYKQYIPWYLAGGWNNPDNPHTPKERTAEVNITPESEEETTTKKGRGKK